VIVRAVLVMDMSGFSEACEADLDAALELVATFRELACVAVASHGGQLVKCWADNFAAVFPTVRQAVGVAETVGALIPSGAGIGYGPVLLCEDDLWGVEVNRASKLGEDVAKAGGVLLTEAAKCAG
jgi:adenylate cyclase